MKIDSCKFIKSCTHIKDYPSAKLPEYALVGRSNVGKSSLLNMLLNRRKLAHTSSKPGKTQTLNFYLVNENWQLVDLPGYGYAKSSKRNRAAWHNFSEQYLRNRENLMSVMCLVDLRVPPQKSDLEFMKWLGMNQIPFIIVFTKSDKLKANEQDENLKAMKNTLLEDWEEIPKYFITSAQKKKGRDDLLNFIEETNLLFNVKD